MVHRLMNQPMQDGMRSDDTVIVESMQDSMRHDGALIVESANAGWYEV